MRAIEREMCDNCGHRYCICPAGTSRLHARIRELEAALRKYGRHAGECRTYARSNQADCTCGLTAARDFQSDASGDHSGN